MRAHGSVICLGSARGATTLSITTLCITTLGSTTLCRTGSIASLVSTYFYHFLQQCWESLCWVPLCRVSLCRVSRRRGEARRGTATATAMRKTEDKNDFRTLVQRERGGQNTSIFFSVTSLRLERDGSSHNFHNFRRNKFEAIFTNGMERKSWPSEVKESLSKNWKNPPTFETFSSKKSEELWSNMETRTAAPPPSGRYFKYEKEDLDDQDLVPVL